MASAKVGLPKSSCHSATGSWVATMVECCPYLPSMISRTSLVCISVSGFRRSNGLKYGKLYNWYAIKHKGSLAPEGWKIPDYWDWKKLFDHLGGEEVAGGKLKQTGTDDWNDPNKGATNESGFSALPGGYRLGDNGNFGLIGDSAQFWSATECNENTAGTWYMDTGYPDVFGGNGYKHYAFSVRCVKD
jgi:uncharacterized protein (TIGR02145 family)